MSDELWSRALALPPAERARLAHALMDSLYEDVEWDDGAGFGHPPEKSGIPPVVAEVIDLDQRRAPSRRA